MGDAVLDGLVGQVSGPGMMGHLREFARWVKLSGTPEELQSLHYVKAKLEEYGFRTEMVMHDAYISLPGRASVTVDNVALKAITHSHGQPGTVRGRVVDVGEGTAADFAGKDVKGAIVLAQGIANPATSRLASLAGAAAQLHVSPHEHIHEMCVSPVWGSPTSETLADMPSTVVCSVAHDDGMALKARLARGESPAVVLEAEVDTSWRKTPILVAHMDRPGAGAEDPFVLFSGHHDTWYYGVMDNGSANATMLETARVLAGQRDQWARGLRLCFWSGHSHGRYSGSVWYVDEHWDELDRRCVAHVNVDSTGGVGASVLENAAAVSELTTLAAEAIGQRTGHGYLGKRKSRSSDDSLPGVGVPSMFGALSEQAPGTVKMRNSLGWWWHTPDDTIDKLDEANLVRDTRVFVHAVGRLVRDAVIPLDYVAHAKAMQAELAKIEGTLGGRFSLAGLMAGAKALEANAAAAAKSTAGAAAVNAALMAASRALVPVDYAKGDRFTHEPALPMAPWATLDPVRALAKTAAGSAAEHHATVGAMRARNRVAFALREANAALAAVAG